MRNIKLCLDRQRYRSKPTGTDAARISKRIVCQTKILDTENFQGFVGDVGVDGHTFCPTTFKGEERRKDSFEQMQLFGLDFDNDKPERRISFESVKARADKFNLPVLFAYETFSSILCGR